MLKHFFCSIGRDWPFLVSLQRFHASNEDDEETYCPGMSCYINFLGGLGRDFLIEGWCISTFSFKLSKN